MTAPGQPRTTSRSAAGFTLPELLLAIVILAIGMSLTAAVFPTAMIYNQRSFEATDSGLICPDALAVARTVLAAGDVNNDDLAVLGDADNNVIEDQHRDLGDVGDRTRGFVLLGHQIASGGQVLGHRLVVVAYIARQGAEVVAEPIQVSAVSDRTDQIRVAEDGRNPGPDTYERIGKGAVIVFSDGRFARVAVPDPNSRIMTLDREVNLSSGSHQAFVVYDRSNSDMYLINPCVGAMTTVTALR